MSIFQPVKFKSIDDFIISIPKNERIIVDHLRAIVFDTIPNVTEKLSYNVPFYSRIGRIAFIWPSSVLWGKVRAGGVQFGFCAGYMIKDELNWLDRAGRKQVYTKTWHRLEEIDTPTLKAYLELAAEIDAAKAKAK